MSGTGTNSSSGAALEAFFCSAARGCERLSRAVAVGAQGNVGLALPEVGVSGAVGAGPVPAIQNFGICANTTCIYFVFP